MALSRTLDRVGLVLGGRYRLLSPIGTGASASVYLADDVTLRRRVAVKVLHEALAEDEAFLRRFQAEAQAAAALNHPHIMAVHDWGDTGEWPFLVMEHLGGGSLRAVLDVGPDLSLSQALIVGLEAARGLDYAHRRGFVHRDIKPANLLFDDEARLRIADFGLARALAEAAWTEPMGAVLGTARYASPEQAQGATLDGRSDVYSLALVLIEAVTGVVPFRADTTLGTLMARVEKQLPVPAEMGALRPALEAAGRPDPRDRVDAAELGSMLLAAAERLDRPRPIPLPGAALPLEQLADRHPTDVAGADAAAPRARVAGPVVPEPDDDITGIVDLRPHDRRADTDTDTDTDAATDAQTDEGGHPFDWQEDSDFGSRRGRRARRRGAGGDGRPATASMLATDAEVAGLVDPTVVSPLEALARADLSHHGRSWDGGEATDDDEDDEWGDAPVGHGRGRRVARALLVSLLVLSLLGGAGVAGWWYLVRIPVHTVASFVGQPVGTAEKAASANNWILTTQSVHANDTFAGQILAQAPAAGTELEEKQAVSLTVSLGPAPVAVPPDLAGRPVSEVQAALESVGLALGELSPRFDEAQPKDTVIAVAAETPAELPRGSGVALVVSAGPEPRTVPSDLVGVTIETATARLNDLGLEVVSEEEFSETVAKGIVVAVPAAGSQVERGGDVTLTVSKGPELVAVPKVAGLSVVDAGAKIEAEGLEVSGTQGSPTRPVVGTNPPAGTMVRKGTSVTLTTG